MTQSRRGGRAGRCPLPFALFLVAAVLTGVAAFRLNEVSVPGAGFNVSDVPETGPPSFAKEVAARAPEGDILHAPSIVETAPGELLAVWYQGSREGARDVKLVSARRLDGAWQKPEVVTSTADTARELHRAIRTIGNPVLLARAPGELWLIYVTTVGGWSTSALNLKRSRDGGRTWDEARRLVATPFFNISTLVKAPPFVFADGHVAVPAYEEMAAKLPELFVLDNKGNVVDRRRMGGVGRVAIQPFIAARDHDRALALMRPVLRGDRHARMTLTADGGRSWSGVTVTSIPNPGGPVSVLHLSADLMLLVFNNDPADESDISLAVSRDGGATWTSVATLDRNAPGEPPSLTYPSASVGSDGTIHAVYVDRRDESIHHVAFNRAWVEARAEATQ